MFTLARIYNNNNGISSWSSLGKDVQSLSSACSALKSCATEIPRFMGEEGRVPVLDEVRLHDFLNSPAAAAAVSHGMRVNTRIRTQRMVYGARTGVPLLVGLSIGVVLALLTSDFAAFQPSSTVRRCPSILFSEPLVDTKPVDYVDNAEHWEVVVKKPSVPQTNAQRNVRPPSNKVVRARYAVTELGIKEKLMVIILGQSSLSFALNASIGIHVPRVQVFIDSSRLDPEAPVPLNVLPYHQNGEHVHVPVLNSVFNHSFHENFDWFLIIPDSSYANPFRLRDMVDHMNWNVPRTIGIADSEGNCRMQGGILLSNPAMQTLTRQRKLCNSIVKASDQEAFEECIRHATNLTCTDYVEGYDYYWWKVDEESGESGGASAIHDRVRALSKFTGFNDSLAVSPLLSESDVQALHEHFVLVEISKIEKEIERLGAESEDISLKNVDGPSWPNAIPAFTKPPNRYQVPKWEYFTETEIFRNKPNQNVEPLRENDLLDVQEVVEAAKRKISEDSVTGLKFIRLRNGYRQFDARRGMNYMVDLVYHSTDEITGESAGVLKRVHLCRPIVNMKLLYQVPYVKEDADVTAVVPIQSTDDAVAFRKFVRRHRDLCASSPVDGRQTRIAVVIRRSDTTTARLIGNYLNELKAGCKSWQMDTAILLLRSDSEEAFEIDAMDAAVDHYGSQMIYLFLPPYADYQKEFYDRVRINTIRHYQAYIPIPFSQFNPNVLNAYNALMESEEKAGTRGKNDQSNLSDNMYIDGQEAERMKNLHLKTAVTPGKKIKEKPLVVHKDQGVFDTNDFSVFSIYGDDYVQLRDAFRERNGAEATRNLLDLAPMFLNESSVHLLRAVEPTMRLRYRQRTCDNKLPTADYARCVLSRSETLATKAQLAKIIFSHLSEKS